MSLKRKLFRYAGRWGDFVFEGGEPPHRWTAFMLGE